VHGAGEVLGSFEFSLHKGLVDDHLGGDVGQFTSLPGFHLLSHRLKASLHSVDTNRNAVDERDRLRVFREHRGKHSWDNVSKTEARLIINVKSRVIESLAQQKFG
jgi:hypothetical protein